MTRDNLLISALLFLLVIASVAPIASAQPAPADWTFMVYLDGDNDLELAGINDFLEMASVGSNADVKILVLFDRHPGHYTGYDDWTETRRGIVNNGDQPNSSWGTSMGELNMGDPQTLIDFVEWGMQNHPADRHAVILWDHGNGWREEEPEEPSWRKVCGDDSSGGDSIMMPELRTALSTIQNDEQKVDLLGFDACLMAMTEVAYEIRWHADAMVASELSTPLAGWPYHTILGDLVADPEMGTADLASTIVTRWHASYGYEGTQSAVNLSLIDEVVTQTDALAQTLRDHWNNDQAACAAHAYEVMVALDAAIFAEAHGSEAPASHGLTIYFPTAASAVHGDYTGSYILFLSDTRWDEFLDDYYAFMMGSWVGVARSQAQNIHQCAPPNWCHVDHYDFCRKLIDNAAGVIWVDFAHTGSERGTFDEPYNTLDEAVTAAAGGETVLIKCGSSPEVLTVSKDLLLRACGGPVTIGVQP